MNWDEDIDELAGKKLAPKQGRRAGNIQGSDGTEQLLDNSLNSLESVSLKETLSQRRRSGGWADDGTKSAKNRVTSNLIEEERFQEKNLPDSDDDDDIPIIPDIEDIQEDLLSPQEIKAPTVLINTSTYKELDKDMSTVQSTPSELQALVKSDEIDLSLLTKRLCPEKDVRETDEEWTMDSLFNDFIAVNTAS